MTYRGHMQQGVVVLDDELHLPEGVAVRVEVEEDLFLSLREGLRSFAGTVEELPSDMAENHDLYIHGTCSR